MLFQAQLPPSVLLHPYPTQLVSNFMDIIGWGPVYSSCDDVGHTEYLFATMPSPGLDRVGVSMEAGETRNSQCTYRGIRCPTQAAEKVAVP